jgi:protein arginine N-methyltransferase 1
MEPLQEIAITEPVVDVVDAKALVTDSVPILTLDILTCTKEDLVFKNTFKLQSQRNDYIHGLLTYFECAFTQVHKAIGFSTAPFARYTHWKQTIFYLKDEITICNGETIEGDFSCKQNDKNHRDLDIVISLKFLGRYTHLEKEGIKFRLR